MLMLRATGMFLVALGFIWVLQGAGLIGWPADSLMLGQRQWIFHGALAAAAGTAILWWAARDRRG